MILRGVESVRRKDGKATAINKQRTCVGEIWGDQAQENAKKEMWEGRITKGSEIRNYYYMC
jgi:hypothetical protein